MRANGNLTQWSGGYPSEALIRQDIDAGNCMVIEDDGKLSGVFICIIGDEPTYAVIEDGRWLDDTLPYATIHRLASAGLSHGVAASCFDWAWEKTHNVRIDTHRDNTIMQRCIRHWGFRYCGIIHVADGSPRLAFQKTAAPVCSQAPVL